LPQRTGTCSISHEGDIGRYCLERLNEVYSEFFLYYDDAALLIVNAGEFDLASGEADYRQLVDYLLDIRSDATAPIPLFG
jgi:deoxyadenosine/deoxycytidine kinase